MEVITDSLSKIGSNSPITTGITGIFDPFFRAIPSVFFAIFLLALAFVVALISKILIIKLLKIVKADKIFTKIGIKDEMHANSMEFIGKLVFILVFLLFLPGALDQLGIQSVTQPISNMISTILNFVPNILAAAIILFLGAYIAGMIRQLLVPILKKLKVDSLNEKLGMENNETTLSSMLGYVAYVLIMIPVVIASLQVLNIEAISVPAIAMLNTIFAYIPKIFVAAIILIIGVSIAKLIKQLLSKILSGLGADVAIKKLLPKDTKLAKFSVSEFISSLVMYVLILFFLVEALNVINLAILTTIGQTIIAYLPRLISAVLIMVAGIIIAAWAETGMKEKFADNKIGPTILKIAILAVAVFITLSQLGIASNIVTAAFILILGAFAVAFAVAFGLGGRQFAANLLQWLEDKTFKNKKDN